MSKGIKSMRHLIGLLSVDGQLLYGLHSLDTMFAILNYGFAFKGSPMMNLKEKIPPKKRESSKPSLV